jgi:syntaxin-binding protein 5
LHLDGASDEKQTQLTDDTVGSQGQTGKGGNDLDKKQAPGVGKHQKTHLSQNGDSDSLLLVCCEDILLLLSFAPLVQVCT